MGITERTPNVGITQKVPPPLQTSPRRVCKQACDASVEKIRAEGAVKIWNVATRALHQNELAQQNNILNTRGRGMGIRLRPCIPLPFG